MSGDLERRYRRALRLLPRYYRDQWEEDMVAAFLDSSLTGDPEEDEFALEYGRPSWPEVASVAALALRLNLGGAGAPRRYFAWGQAVRRAVLVVMLGQAVFGLVAIVSLAWTHHLLGWLPAPPHPHLVRGQSAAGDNVWPAVRATVGYAYIVVYVGLLLGYYRTAQLIALLAAVPFPVYLLHMQSAYHQPWLAGPWAGTFLFVLAPVLAMAAFRRDAPPVARRPWLLALAAGFVLVAVPMLAAQMTGYDGWVPGYYGLGCILVAVLSLVQARSRRASSRPASSRLASDPGAWSLALVLLAAVAAVVQIAWLTTLLHEPGRLIQSLVELAVMAIAVALIVPDAGRTQTAMPARPRAALDSGQAR
ncbi:MAG: hypothetical protein ABSA93_21575 [Streptosporangiaceae bacterium]|jgi:hypothetical protein